MNTAVEFKSVLQSTLSDVMVALNTKSDLVEFANLFGLPYKQSLKKQELAEYIEKNLLEHLEVLMYVLPKEELLDLQKIVRAGGYLETKEELNVFELEYRTLVLRPNEVENPFDNEEEVFKYELPGNLLRSLAFTIDKMVSNPYVDIWDRKDRICVGLLQLYGVLSEREFSRLWEIVTGEALEMRDLLKMLQSRALVRGLCNPFYIDRTLCLAHSSVDYPVDMYHAVMKRKDLDYFIHPLEIVLLAADSYLNIVAPEKLIPLLEILDKMYGVYSDHTVVQLTALWKSHQNGAPAGKLIAALASEFTFDSKEHINKTMMALTNLTNALPSWLLKGHSPDELHAKRLLNVMDRSDNVVPFIPKPSVGRNDPCPCGSGKKYKKCCGAN